MSGGIDWKTIGDDGFEAIVDVLLSREFGDRGNPLDGRGGEGDVPGDFSVDDGKIIFEYKYFPQGFPASGSRRSQIKRSFKQQKKRDPEQWILVVPSKLTPWEKTFLDKLGADTTIAISYRDRVWLDDQLADNPGVANYFRHYSDNDYLIEKAQQFKNYPLVATSQDMVTQLSLLMATADDADPHWGWDIATHQGSVMQTLVAKHPNAPLLSPVKLSFKGNFESGSQTARDLQQANAFGFSKPITIPGRLVRDFTVTGPPIVAFEGEIDELQIGPTTAGDWFDMDLVLTRGSDEVLGTFPGRARGTARGEVGWSFELAIGTLINLNFRAPYTSGEAGGADFTVHELTGARPSDVVDAADFVIQLHDADEIHLRVATGNLAAMKVTGRFDINHSLQDYLDVREIARDLAKIEQETSRRFRYPATLDVEERVMIRNLRLMFEGYCVAHPTWNQFNAVFNGKTDQSLEQFLDTERHWIFYTGDTIILTILGQQIPLEHLYLAGIFAMPQAEVDDLRNALKAGTAAGRELKIAGRPGDRIRMFLKDRYGDNKPIELTPWGLDGIIQKGLTLEGRPILDEATDPSHPS